MTFRHETVGVSNKRPNILVHEIGNVTNDTDLTFELDITDAEIIRHYNKIPIQVRVSVNNHLFLSIFLSVNIGGKR